MSRRYGLARAFALATLLGLPQAGGARANDGLSTPLTTQPAFPGIADAVAQIDETMQTSGG